MLDSQSYQPANYLDSAILSSLRQLIDLHPALEQATGQLPRFDIVLDANIAIGDLLHKHQNPHLEQTALQEVVKSGVVRLYAPSWLETEMLSSTIPQVSQKYKIPQETLFSSWENYKAIIIFDARFDHPQEVNTSCLDPKDAPYVQLQNAILALGILSNDKDIDALGGTRLDRQVVMAIRTYARSASYSVSIKVGGVVVSNISLLVLRDVILFFRDLVARVPDWMKLLLLIGACFVLAHPDSRARLISVIKSIVQGIGDVWPDIQKFLVYASDRVAQEQQALAELNSSTTPYIGS
jgi:predicted nucleic acid-binding protein